MQYSKEMFAQFCDLLNQLTLNLEVFIDALESERKLLDSNQIILLDEILQHKTQILDRINIIYQSTHQILDACQYLGDKSKLANFIQQLSLNDQHFIKPIWAKTQALLYQSDRLNLINGVIITIMKNHNASLLHLLVQKPQENIYGHSNNQHVALSTMEHKI